MNNYLAVTIIWLTGWLIACLTHRRNRDIVRIYGTLEDIKILEVNKSGLPQYLTLFFTWPNYLFL